MTALQRLAAALERTGSVLPWHGFVSEPDMRDAVESLRHKEAHKCVECGEPTCLDPSECEHQVICGECFPDGCGICCDRVGDDRKAS